MLGRVFASNGVSVSFVISVKRVALGRVFATRGGVSICDLVKWSRVSVGGVGWGARGLRFRCGSGVIRRDGRLMLQGGVSLLVRGA